MYYRADALVEAHHHSIISGTSEQRFVRLITLFKGNSIPSSHVDVARRLRFDDGASEAMFPPRLEHLFFLSPWSYFYLAPSTLTFRTT
jgi:hypothetical protein